MLNPQSIPLKPVRSFSENENIKELISSLSNSNYRYEYDQSSNTIGMNDILLLFLP